MAPALAALLLAAVMAGSADGAKNILYLMMDDCRPQFGAYGQKYMKTPNIDALAQRSLVFDNAYTQFAYCAPSRNSFLSGRRPDRTKVLNFLYTFRELGGENWTAMPEFFKKQGYFTTSAGKIYHDGQDDKQSWSYPSNQTAWIQCSEGDLADEYGNYCGVTAKSKFQYTDEDLALHEGLERLELAAQQAKPWWVSIGVHRPHHSYRNPIGFYGPDIYPGAVVLPPEHPDAPAYAAWMSGNFLEGDIKDPARGCPNCTVPPNRSIEYRRWYYASVTYSDHMLGLAIQKLTQLGLENDTIIVFHADHGYQLGELNEWSKKTDTELAARVPLIVHVPWKPNSQGQRTRVKAELVDMYRTLADLAGFSSETDVEPGVQGTSLAPLFDNPLQPPPALANKVAYSQIGRCACGWYQEHGGNWQECGAGACVYTPVAQFDYIGYSMRTDTWRFTAWAPMDNTTLRVNWNGTVTLELYDMTGDDGQNFDFAGNNVNVVAQHEDLAASMLQTLKAAVNAWY